METCNYYSDMVKHELRVASYERRVESLRIHKLRFKSMSSNQGVTSSNLPVMSSNPRVTSLFARVTSSNTRVASSNLGVTGLNSRVTS